MYVYTYREEHKGEDTAKASGQGVLYTQPTHETALSMEVTRKRLISKITAPQW